MGLPVFRTGAPRTTPSVGRMAMAFTVESPMCCATSQTIVDVSPSNVRSSSSAVMISGRSPGANSTFTTGPITSTTLPSVLSSATFTSLLRRLLQSLRSSDDLHELGGDLGLPRLVGHPGEEADHVFGILRRRLHGPAPGRVLRSSRLEHRMEDLCRHVSRQKVVEDLLRRRLEDVFGRRLPTGRRNL